MANPARRPNVGDLIGRDDLDIAGEVRFQGAETPAERSARIKEKAEAAAHDRWKDRLFTVAAVAVVGMTFLIGMTLLLVPGFNDDSKKWAAVTVTSILSAAIGFVGGKASK